MTKILVTGASGQLGREWQMLAGDYPGLEFYFASRQDLDITDEPAVTSLFGERSFDYCLNAAAYTKVDKAEIEVEMARLVNVDGVKHLAESCLLHRTHLFHFSSDYVYHNGKNSPLREEDPVEPKGVYAATKLEGEQIAARIHLATTIIRTSWLYSSFGNNFVKTMLRLGQEREELRVVYDQVGTPTYARHLARAVLHIIDRAADKRLKPASLSGIFNYSNEGVASWYDFAEAIFELSGITCRLTPIESRDFPTPALRPPFSLLNKHKFKSAFHYTIPHWRQGLKECLQALLPSGFHLPEKTN